MPAVWPHRQWHICFAGFCNLMSATVPKIWLMPPLLSPVIGSNSTGKQSRHLSWWLARCEPEVWLNRAHKQATQRDKQPISQGSLVAHLTERLESNPELCRSIFFLDLSTSWNVSYGSQHGKYLSYKLLVWRCSEVQGNEDMNRLFSSQFYSFITRSQKHICETIPCEWLSFAFLYMSVVYLTVHALFH